jgi:DNA-binding CsgD family transcriptional regulator
MFSAVDDQEREDGLGPAAMAENYEVAGAGAATPENRQLPPRLRPLSMRQLQVVLCILAGDNLAETARHLDLSAATVRYHLTRAYEVLEIADRDSLRALPLMTDLPHAA